MAASWFPFWCRDFLAATIGWTAEERGHYMMLLITQWEQDGLPIDPKRLELVSPGVSRCWEILEPKFPISVGGKRRNPRLEYERHLANERSERARQSASKRWAKDCPSSQDSPVDDDAVAMPSHMRSHCSDLCPDDASITTSYSPPTPPSPSADLDEETAEKWIRLRDAWNAVWGEKRRWVSQEPPSEAIARIREPGWLDEAISGIPQIKSGLCAGFETPPTLRQYCGRTPKGSFVQRMLGGEFVDKKKRLGVPA